MPRISLTARNAFNARQTDEVPVVLVTITHDDLIDGPIYLSSDPTERLSTDPLKYGTISNGITYEWVLMSAVLPDDRERTPPGTQLVFENVDKDMVALARSISTPPRIDMSVVLASAPDLVEITYANLKATRRSYDVNQITLDISRDPLTSEPAIAHRMTRVTAPGLFR